MKLPWDSLQVFCPKLRVWFSSHFWMHIVPSGTQPAARFSQLQFFPRPETQLETASRKILAENHFHVHTLSFPTFTLLCWWGSLNWWRLDFFWEGGLGVGGWGYAYQTLFLLSFQLIWIGKRKLILSSQTSGENLSNNDISWRLM